MNSGMNNMSYNNSQNMNVQDGYHQYENQSPISIKFRGSKVANMIN